MAKEKETLLVQSKVRDTIRELGKGDIRVSEEFLASLNDAVHGLIEGAIRRTKDNGRATLRPADV